VRAVPYSVKIGGGLQTLVSELERKHKTAEVVA